MTVIPFRGPVVIDTNVYGASLGQSPLRDLYRPVITGREAFISFQTVAELRFGAVRRNWGPRRMQELEARIGEAEIVHTEAGLIDAYARLRADCERVGHALSQQVHNADRWIAATAVWLGLPLVAHDGVFQNAPGLTLETLLN